VERTVDFERGPDAADDRLVLSIPLTFTPKKGSLMRKQVLFVAVLALAFAWGFSGAALAADYKSEYKLSTVVGKPFPWGIAGERWAELVKEKTGGRINIRAYPGDKPGGRRSNQGVHRNPSGAIDLASGPPSTGPLR